eukprot:652749-Rhodomonas_salina.1
MPTPFKVEEEVPGLELGVASLTDLQEGMSGLQHGPSATRAALEESTRAEEAQLAALLGGAPSPFDASESKVPLPLNLYPQPQTLNLFRHAQMAASAVRVDHLSASELRYQSMFAADNDSDPFVRSLDTLPRPAPSQAGANSAAMLMQSASAGASAGANAGTVRELMFEVSPLRVVLAHVCELGHELTGCA